METSNVNVIRETIKVAKQREQEHGNLRRWISIQLPEMHNSIRLPDNNAEDALLDFSTRYIEQVPDFVEAIANITQKANVFGYVDTFLDIATDFFIHPPQIVSNHKGLAGLLDEAYLAHRFIEEINDRFIGYCGAPLSPMDMTVANLVVHDLIGEPFANQLDTAVQFTIEMQSDREAIFKSKEFLNYLKTAQQREWKSELEQWPCLARDLSISLELGNQAVGANMH